jgi:hypothetical protein
MGLLSDRIIDGMSIGDLPGKTPNSKPETHNLPLGYSLCPIRCSLSCILHHHVFQNLNNRINFFTRQIIMKRQGKCSRCDRFRYR